MEKRLKTSHSTEELQQIAIFQLALSYGKKGREVGS
jgi:hypothetical protein